MVLPHGPRLWIDRKKKKGGLKLAIGEIKGIPIAGVAGSCVNSPTHGIFHGGAQVAKGKSERWAEGEKEEDQNRGKELLPLTFLQKNRTIQFFSSESSNVHEKLGNGFLIWGLRF
jgi:hypothetical protein